MSPYYQDDWVTLYHGDARDLAPHLTAHVMVTDPPYGIAWTRSNNTSSQSRPHAGIANDHDTTARDDLMETFADLPQIVFGSPSLTPPTTTQHIAVYEKPTDAGIVGSTIGLRRDVEMIYFCGPWPKATPHRGSVFRTTIAGNRGIPHTGDHPHVKAPDVMRTLIELCPPGVIIDPFAGSGTTLRAAKDLGRHAIGIEIDETYCEVAARRLGQEVLFT